MMKKADKNTEKMKSMTQGLSFNVFEAALSAYRAVQES